MEKREAGRQPGRQAAEEKTNVTIYGIVAATCTCNNEAATAAAAAAVIRVCATCVCNPCVCVCVCAGSAARRHVSTDQLVISFCSAASSAAAAGNPYKPNMLTKHEKQN